jgi:hypothetical protein
MRKKLLALLPGDALITMGAALVGLHALYERVPHWVLSLGVWLFTAGGVVLLVLHGVAWKFTLLTYWSKATEDTAAAPTQVRKVESDISCNGQPLHVTLSLIVPADSAGKAPPTSPKA